MVRTAYVRNKKTGTIRVLDYHEPHEDDPPAERAFHAKYPPRPFKPEMYEDEELFIH